MISIITATYNRGNVLRHALNSVDSQTYSDYEHLIQDGGSSDDTLETLSEIQNPRRLVENAPDKGIYDALNRAFKRSSGDVVGVLHSDDFFANDYVLEKVALAFSDPAIDAVYGDLQYVAKENTQKVIRNWVSGAFFPGRLHLGWMPPHPALFLRRRVIERWGGYDLSYSIAADYDAILRYFSKPDFSAVYIPEVLVKMRVGGESNRSLERVLNKSYEDFKALRKNKIPWTRALLLKNLSKIKQFIK